MKRWYVVHTHAKSEAKALNHLLRQGFEAYLPMYLKQRRHARRVDQVSTPLFPRYLFVCLDLEATRWHPIKSTIGVIGLISHGIMPSALPTAIIEEIRRNESESGYLNLHTFQNFKKGDSVQIMMGALCDQVGMFECAEDNERINVLLNLLGREVRISLPAEAVAAHG